MFNASEIDLQWTVPGGKWARDWVVELDTDLAGHEPAAGEHRAVAAVVVVEPRATAARWSSCGVPVEQRLTTHDRRADRARRAAGAGAAARRRDVVLGRRRAPPRGAGATLRAVVDVLEADDAADADRTLEPVVVGRHGARRRRRVDRRRARSSPTARRSSCRRSTARVALPPDLPIGCHCSRRPAPGVEETATVVVAPATMPARRALAGGAGLFVPTYALWEPRVAAAVVRPPRRARRRGPRQLGIDVVSTLPLYAAFLDEPFDPSPYAPVSRLHWNEVYLDDCGAARGARTPPFDELIDWRAARPPPAAPAARRGPRPRPVHPGRDRPLRRRPARRRRLRPLPRRTSATRSTPAARRRSSSAATCSPSTSPTASSPRRGSGPGRAGARPADRQPPRRLRDVGPRRRCSPPA